jgi:hypothetical protein
MRKSMACFLVLTLVLSSLMMAACGGKKEQTSSGEVTEETGKPEKKADRGGGGWSDVPEYKGAAKSEVEVPMNVPAAARGEYERSQSRQYQTIDTPQQVHEYYLEQMPKKGWHKLFAMKYPEGSAVSAWVKGDEGRGCVVSTGTLRDGKTYIGHLLNEGKK